ncbi:MAG: nitrite reductase, copper-containing [Gammaproteobacteria bacterium RBG_16_66_13]|nr:MAG: nitrite reductase, copper-containing [Gammaproteobacteria bacterium RBG_16_66_13]
MKVSLKVSALSMLLAFILGACAPAPTPTPTSAPSLPAPTPADAEPAVGEPTVRYTLVTGGGTGKLVFVGQGGEIDGQENPTLTAQPGDVVEITLINGDYILHDLAIEELEVKSAEVQTADERTTVTFVVELEGEYAYFCTIPGHRQAGMVGIFRVGEPAPTAVQAPSIVKHPADLPAPVGSRGPEIIDIELAAEEIVGQLADGTSYPYFTFNGTVPGPFLRVRLGDTVNLTLRNETSSTLSHSIDLHAVNGPGGGAVYTQTPPGESNAFSFQALNPGLYVYHCATPSVPHHITSGMYGLILVEPEGGLPPVDQEFYVMQGEIYTAGAFGAQGAHTFSMEKMLAEAPEYFVFNGAAGALTLDENVLRAAVGDTLRIFFGVGGPNGTSSFHVIGEIFDRVYPFAALTSPPLTDVQTVSVPPGGATMVEFKVEVPGRYLLVDHALSRLERGLVGFLMVDGEENPAIFSGELTEGAAH